MLTFPYMWEKFGALTPAESAAVFQDMFDRFCLGDGSCRVIGEIIAYAGAVSPNANWLPCDGRPLAIATYPDLYAVLGDTYGTPVRGNFFLPDLRGRAGVQADATNHVLGSKYGSADTTLTVENLPEHSHPDSGHQHTTGNSIAAVALTPGELPVLSPNPVPALTGSASANNAPAGSGTAFSTVGPRIAINYLIVAKEG